MKLRAVSFILALSLFAVGCNVNVNVDDKAETGSNEVVAEDKENDGIIYDDGTPWIDSDLKINIDDQAKPDVKDDFHFSVNYEWLKSTEIRDGYTAESSFTAAEDATVKRTVSLLLDDTLKGHDAELIRSLYTAVTDWDKRNELGMEPVKPVIGDIARIRTLDELSDFICDPQRSNCVSAFVSIANETGLLDSSRYITYINNDTLLLEDAAEYTEMTSAGERAYEAKKALATAMLKRLGMKEDEAEARFNRVMGFEEKIARNALTRSDFNDPDIFNKINNIYTREEIGDLTHSFPLIDFIDGFGYGNAEEYAVYQPEVIKTIDELYTEENLDVMKDYMIINYLLYAADKLDRECYELSVLRINTQFGTSGGIDDETLAYNTILKMIPEPLEKVYLDKYDASGMKEDITLICRDIISEYEKMLKHEEWLSEDTRIKAVNKLEHMRVNAVYPDKWIGYDNLELKGLDYLSCARAVNKFNADIDRSRTGKSVDRELWTMNILQSNAFYNKQDNSINIILGILDDAFYDEAMSREEKLGGIGTVIGHEISHAFDEKGAQFDEEGKLNSWWNENDHKAYGERVSALIDHYDRIKGFNGACESGENVKAEAIADMAGVKVVLDMVRGEPDFDYDKFFRQYARVWKSVTSPEAEYDKMLKDQHPLNYLRTNVTLQQYDEFFRTYDIKSGDGMYLEPDERIAVW